jgi:hypothetical protein
LLSWRGPLFGTLVAHSMPQIGYASGNPRLARSPQ